ncbi:MAG: FeoA family protein [bacterium]|nr:FeoA family protein [bacterium]
MNKLLLSNLSAGQTARISHMNSSGSIRRRLQDIGLIEGTQVECVGKSPLGDPAAFLIRGAVVALRCEDSSKILVNRIR